MVKGEGSMVKGCADGEAKRQDEGERHVCVVKVWLLSAGQKKVMTYLLSKNLNSFF